MSRGSLLVKTLGDQLTLRADDRQPDASPGGGVASDEKDEAGSPPLRGRLRYPHRIASWCLAGSTLIFLIAFALIWSTVLSDRWTILSLSAAVITFTAL
ncbi:MAG: hypothetical protein AAFO29_08570, partial [Actinomycetota bacterium]